MNSKIRKIMKRKFFAIAAMMLLMPMMMGAQTLKGSYFLDNSLNRHKLNPAFAPRGAYFQLPAIGNFGVGLSSNLEVSTFLYPMNGQLYTFLNKNVSVSQFEKTLAKHPYLDMDVDMNLLSFGFKVGRAFWNIEMGLRADVAVDVPRDLFTFMKKGTGTSGVYNIGNMKANASVSAQASLGYSRDFSDLVPGLRAGAKVRAILPAAYIGMDLHDASLTTSPEKWTVSTDGTVHAAMKGLELTDSEGAFNPAFNGIPGLAGFGLSFDLGVEYKLEFAGFINGVSFSAAVTDLGAVKYNGNAVQTYGTEGQMDWTGLKISLEEGAMDDAMDDLTTEFEKLLVLEKKESASVSRSTLPRFYLGVEMPFLNNTMSVGALYSGKKSYSYMRNELTLSYNLNPVKWFALGVNYSFLNVVKTMGLMLELTPKYGPCIYFGVDYFPVEWFKAPENLGVPILPMSARVNAQLGIAFALGTGKNKNK